MWTIPKIWEGGQCVIIGGGPSIVQQFDIPESVVQAVRLKQVGADAYSPYLSPIHGCHVIAINMAYKLGNWIDCVFFGDASFLTKCQVDVLNWEGLRVTNSSNESTYQGRLKIVGRDDKKLGISNYPDKLCWNLNSGGGAIDLAVHFGVKRVILLGFDMKLGEDGKSHWHKYYAPTETMIEQSMQSHIRCFPIIAKDLKGKVEVINCNPDSAIKDFPRMNFKDITL
jgi:hypothetical protein